MAHDTGCSFFRATQLLLTDLAVLHNVTKIVKVHSVLEPLLLLTSVQ